MRHPECGSRIPEQQADHGQPGACRLAQGLRRFDLPIALGILGASGQIEAARLTGHEFAGELSLSGQLRPVRGALAMALALHTRGIATRLVLPAESAQEAALVPDAEVYGARHLLDVVRQFVPPADSGSLREPDDGEGWARSCRLQPIYRPCVTPTWPT